MTLKIYGRRSSANVQKVVWLCCEANLKFDIENFGGKYGGNESNEFKSMNPNGRVPVLQDNDFILYESNSIIKYLSRKYKIFDIDNIEQQALINQWIDWSSHTLAAPCSVLTAHKYSLPIDLRDKEKVIESKKQILPLLKILNDQLLINDYVVGKNFTLADIPAGCWFNRCRNLNVDLSDFHGIIEWSTRLDNRSAFKSAVVSAPMPPN